MAPRPGWWSIDGGFVRQAAALIGPAMFAIGCGANPGAASTPLPETIAPGAEELSVAVFRESHGDEWPWTVGRGLLRCEPVNQVILEVPDDATYAIDGAARGSGRWADGNDLLREGKTPADVGQMIDLGLELCLDGG